MKPVRIQMKRIKGWRMPSNTVYVGRPGILGNPYLIKTLGRERTIIAFEELMKLRMKTPDWQRVVQSLTGKNLACWCRLTDECHADVLLKMANSEITP